MPIAKENTWGSEASHYRDYSASPLIPLLKERETYPLSPACGGEGKGEGA